MKIAVIPWGEKYCDNKMFDKDDVELNNNNLMTPYYYMKKEFEKNGDEFNTIDQYKDYYEIDYFLFFDLFYDWLFKLIQLGLEDKLIYCNAEPEVVKKINSAAGYKKLEQYFPYIMTWNKDLVDEKRIFWRTIPYYFQDKKGKVAFAQKKMLTNISANKSSTDINELYSTREELITYFENNFSEQFDLYGVGWSKERHPSYKGAPKDKFEVYHNYKFALALENTKNVRGYVTEKIFDCLVAGIVPVYLGADDIEDYVPKSCFIDYRQYSSPEELAGYLMEMSEETYNKYLENIEQFLKTDIQDKVSGEEYARNVYSLIEKTKGDLFKVKWTVKKKLEFYLVEKKAANYFKAIVKKMLK